MAVPLHALCVGLSLFLSPFSSSIKEEVSMLIPFHPLLQIFTKLGMVVDCGHTLSILFFRQEGCDYGQTLPFSG